MKIAILTQPLHLNYGGILQTYALQRVLKKMGHSVETLTIDNKIKKRTFFTELKNFFLSIIRLFLKKIQFANIYWPYNTKAKNLDKMKSKFLPFINKNIKISKPLYTIEEIQQYVLKEHFDAYIVGSDQCWRPMYSSHLEWFFLSFLPINSSDVKRISYAASFGVGTWEYSNMQTNICSNYAKLFDGISVREFSGVELCKNYLGVSAKQLLDPTMLLTCIDYTKIIDESTTYRLEKEIFAYILDNNKQVKEVADKVQSVLSLNLVQYSAQPKLSPYCTISKALDKSPHSIEQWLRAFKDAEFVITDSFHGTVFSILFHKPFIVLLNEKRGNDRITTLLSIFQLENRIYSKQYNLWDTNFLLKGICWKSIDEILAKKRKEGVDFLKNMLQ